MIILKPVSDYKVFEQCEVSKISGKKNQRKNWLLGKVVDSSHRIFEQNIESSGDENNFPPITQFKAYQIVHVPLRKYFTIL